MYMSIRKGQIFEDVLLERLEQFEGYEPSSREDDIYGGADFYYHRLPVDVTLNKNKSAVFSETIIDLPTCSIKVGARFGNGRVKFEEPAMVLLFSPKVESYNLVASDMSEEILECASDIFWTLIDKLEGGDEQ